jgi:hypothetical protein
VKQSTSDADDANPSITTAIPRIPFRVRVGVACPRVLPRDPRLVARVSEVKEQILRTISSTPHTPVYLAVVAALTGDADRLVARALLQDASAVLEAILPGTPADSLADSLTDLSDETAREEREEFEDYEGLLGQAKVRLVAPASTPPEDASSRAQDYVLDRSDVLIALGDGQPGNSAGRGADGTAEVVARARERQMPLYWIATTPPFSMRYEPGLGLHRQVFNDLDHYNQDSVDAGQIHQDIHERTRKLADEAGRAGLEPDVLVPLGEWILPTYAKAHALAVHYRRQYFRFGGDALFGLSALATTIAIGQWLFFHDMPGLAALEFLAMVLALFLVTYGRRRRWHDRWISCRALAEQLRALLFLTLAGVVPETVVSSAYQQAGELDEDEWQWRVLDEVWYQRPSAPVSDDQIESIKQMLVDAWIGTQVDYHERATKRHGRSHRRLTALATTLFFATLLASAFHILGGVASVAGGGLGVVSGHLERIAPLWVLLSVALPACAAALGGIDAQRDHLRQSERSRHMVGQLKEVRERMRRAHSPARVRTVARDVERTILSENRDWLVVMRPRELELPV